LEAGRSWRWARRVLSANTVQDADGNANQAVQRMRLRRILDLCVGCHVTRIANVGAAYFIVLERKIDGLDTGMDGKSIAEHIESLDDAARQVGVRPLSEFFSADPKQLAEFLEDEGVDLGGVEPPALQQFAAQDGLTTIRALALHVAGRGDGVAQDLRECERILSAAAQHGVGWHFEVDF
jgi:hypothetical protein